MIENSNILARVIKLERQAQDTAKKFEKIEARFEKADARLERLEKVLKIEDTEKFDDDCPLEDN